jgi:outer membrane receptor protein involved in Fe transport
MSLSATAVNAESQVANGANPGDAAGPAAMQAGSAVQEVIVTAQKREESIQSVPIAVTAVSGASLQARRIDGGADLEMAVPNMTFSRVSFGGTDYTIRGVGYQVVSTAADTGVSVDENDAPLIVNRLADSEFYDTQRVEVLRGPQGTLFGRNATGGVINVISNKPTDQYSGELTGDYGNYDSREVKGYVNIPINDMFQFRLAGMGLKRDGYEYNAELHDNIDGRNLYSYRASLEFKPSSQFEAGFMWEHFQEDDNRFGGVKFVCAKDPGPTSVGGVPVKNALAQGLLSRGCLQDSVYSNAAQTGTVNTLATLTGSLANTYGLVNGDANAHTFQPGNPRTVDEGINPTYKALNNLYEYHMQWEPTSTLKVTSLTAYSEDSLRTRAAFEDGNVPFNVTPVTPGGVFNDPQTGSSRFVNLDEDYDNYSARQWSEELRVQSSFSGPFNFNLGGLYLNLKRFDDIYILSNATTAITQFGNLLGGNSFVDPNSAPNGSGHNYYNEREPYNLTSAAVFGELYWQATDTVRVTAGARYTDDQKTFVDYPVELLAPGEGYPSQLTRQKADFKEPTGRFTVDWRPHLSYTDQTLIYASYSRGYKAGGFNAPNIVDVSATYAPEFVNSYEVGTKNTLFNHRLSIDLTGFYYDYTGYQISQVEGLNEATANVNANIWGLEFESSWAATRHLRFNANLGYLDARISGGSSIDIFNRTQNDPSLTYLKSSTSACVAPTANVAGLINLINQGVVPAGTLTGACPTAAAPNGAYASSNPAQNPLAAYGVTVPTTAGVPVNLTGKYLPNSPPYTVSLSADYQIDLPADWQAMLHAEYYHQASSYADIYNDPANKLRGWDNINMALSFDRPKWGLTVQFYVKNLLDQAPITDVGVDSESLGLSRSVNYLDPRLVGMSLTKRFQ